MALDFRDFGNGAANFVIAFGFACLLLVLFKWLYQKVTPYDEARLISEGNVAAAIGLSGAVIGFALPVASALSETRNLVEFGIWAFLAGLIQILSLFVMRQVLGGKLKPQIERGNIATGLYLAATYIAVGMLNAASMTY